MSGGFTNMLRTLVRLFVVPAVALFAFGTSDALAAQSAPSSIRVGRTCSCKSCSTVATVSMETYVKRVLPNEWFPSWNAESLKAGAIAIRSYGAYYVYHPVSSSFDICDNACCQVYTTTQDSRTDAAVDATAYIYLLDSSNNIAFAEYSAENNNTGCGNCYTGTCLSDSVCCGATANGHGRGMCQWGSQRWAANQGKTYDWIVDHYYTQNNFHRANLSLPSGTTIIIDNTNAGFTASANWSTGTSSTDKYGTSYRYRSTQAVSDPAQWTANLTKSGTWTISAWWAQGTNRSATAPYVLPGGTKVIVNQQANGGKWNTLGSVSLATGNQSTQLSCWTTSGFIVLADAVKYVGP